MKTVYIASPYTKPEGKQEENVLKSLEVADKLIKMGYIPFTPLLSHYMEQSFPQDYETWMKLDFEWLEKCDCVLRLPGDSSGADREVKRALELGIPVFLKMEEMDK